MKPKSYARRIEMNSNKATHIREGNDRKTRNPGTALSWLCGVMVVCLFHLALVSCTPVSPPSPPQNNGPAFVINSPSEGASVSGATFFSVQPFNANEVQSVSFTANGTELAVDAPGEDTFKVFLIPREFPDGDLTLNAVVTGKDGSRSEKSIKVNVVGNPPSSATVTANGALLGTQEENGAVSTMTIPAGAAEGAAVTFEARTKAQVKAETGIDYDALGVTFLGAQEISTTKSLDTPVAVSSGGFGPMVQPGQIVVNYAIAPDSDGDGIGELMVVNTASVAPNGDVISDPVPQLQLGAGTATDASGTQTLRSLQTGTLSGPPGTFIEIEATGFNQFSAFGNVVIFKSSVDGSEVELPALVNSHFEDPNASPTIGAYIPVLPAGAATMTLKNVSSGQTIAPISITVETAPALTKEPAAIIDETLAEAIRVLSKTPELQDQVSKLEEVRTQFAELGSNPIPEEAQILSDLAVFISNSNMSDLLNQIETSSSSNLSALQNCSLGRLAVSGGMAGYGLALAIIGATLLTAPFTGPIVIIGAIGAGLFGVGTGTLFVGVAGMTFFGSQCLIPPPSPPIGDCLPPYKNTDLAPFLPRNIRAQQVIPPSPITGMGSAPPPGGDSCGSAVGGDPGASLRSSNLVQNQVTGATSFFGDLTGRFIVKVFFGGGSSVVPFTGISDSSGYFYIPFIPEDQPFEAIAFDTLTGQTRSFEGTGPKTGQSTYMFFDFLSEGSSGAKVIEYDTNTEGVLEGVDIYFFEGKRGDRINLAVFSEEVNVGGINFQLSDPNGLLLINSLRTGGHYSETNILQLFTDGLYTFTLDGSKTSGNYTLGLSEIDEPPIAIDPSVPLLGNLEALGDTQFFSFAGNTNDTLDMTLSHDSSSSLNAALVSDSSLNEFGFGLSLVTDDTNRTRTSGPLTLPFDAEYIFLLKRADPLEDELAKHLGTYRIDISLTQ
jgi:hypothetical protein